eukprot:COSAG02_NODE_529_length_20702_cov_43.720555_11_plen_114_part_00
MREALQLAERDALNAVDIVRGSRWEAPTRDYWWWGVMKSGPRYDFAVRWTFHVSLVSLHTSFYEPFVKKKARTRSPERAPHCASAPKPHLYRTAAWCAVRLSLPLGALGCATG